MQLPIRKILNEKWKKENSVLPSIEEWLKSISCSSLVITDSYHGVIFSIIFHRPFVALMNRERGNDRFISLLSLFQLEDRLMDDGASIDLILSNEINWEKVDLIRNEEFNKANSFLKAALES